MLGHHGVQSCRALLLGAFGDELEVDRERAAPERAQRGEVRDEAALVICGATAVPAAVVAPGQRERRRLPDVLAQRRLHVVVAVQEHGGRARGARGGAEHGRVAVGGLELADAVKAGVVEQLGGQLRGLQALLARVLALVGHGRDGDEAGEVLLRAGHEALDVVGEAHARVYSDS